MQVNSFYKNKFDTDNLVMYVLRVTRRSGKEYQLHVEWYKKDDKTKKLMSMGIFQDVVTDTDRFGAEWDKMNY